MKKLTFILILLGSLLMTSCFWPYYDDYDGPRYRHSHYHHRPPVHHRHYYR